MLFFQVALFLAAVYVLVRLIYPDAFKSSKKKEAVEISSVGLNVLNERKQELLDKRGELSVRKQEHEMLAEIAKIDAELADLDDHIVALNKLEEK